jgi:predicted O-methyltransferase YrrM
MKARFPFQHPQIEAVLERQHALARADKWKLAPRLPRFMWAVLNKKTHDTTLRHQVFRDVYSAVTEERGALIYTIARACRAKRVVEFGSSFGISTIYLATAVLDNCAGEPGVVGQVTGTEMEPQKIAAAEKNLEEAGLSQIAMIVQGDARETLRQVEGPVDLAFLDGRKDLYLPVLKILKPKLRDGAVVLSDNIFSFAQDVAAFLAYVQSGENGFVSTTVKISDGIEISIFKKSPE